MGGKSSGLRSASDGTEGNSEQSRRGSEISLWCHCLAGGKGDGYCYLPEVELWVHNGCLLPTRLVYESQVAAGFWDIVCFVQ
jgi:hypothetical protein